MEEAEPLDAPQRCLGRPATDPGLGRDLIDREPTAALVPELVRDDAEHRDFCRGEAHRIAIGIGPE